MKILQIGKFYPPYFSGGIETFSHNIHNALSEKGCNIDFIGFLLKRFKNDIQVDEHIRLFKTDVDICSTQFSRNFVKYYKQHRNDYDIILITLPHPFVNTIMWMYPPKKSTKIILYWQSDIIKQRFILFFYKHLLLWLINRASVIAGPTDIHLNESDFSKYFGNKKQVLPFILNYKVNKTDYKITEDGKKIIFACGRLTHYKGFDVLIDAAKTISDDAVIYISGNGKLRAELEQKIVDLNLQNKVKLLGHITDEELQKYYKDCYLFCFPSTNRAEMMGFVQYEALSYGKPIISTNIPRSGAPTINIEGKSGYKVEINNPEALAERINYVLNNESVYKDLCNGAVELAEKYLDKNIVNKYIECFEKLTDGE